MKVELPLVCPFCDELADRKKGYPQIALPHKLYTPRVCAMGHEFYSVEIIPEDQSAIVQEIKEIRADARAWRRKIKPSER